MYLTVTFLIYIEFNKTATTFSFSFLRPRFVIQQTTHITYLYFIQTCVLYTLYGIKTLRCCFLIILLLSIET